VQNWRHIREVFQVVEVAQQHVARFESRHG
jgi:hypothetical protein